MGMQDHLFLRGQDARKNGAAATVEIASERSSHAIERAGQDVGHDEIEGRAAADCSGAIAAALDDGNAAHEPVDGRVLARNPDRIGVVIRRQHLGGPDLGRGQRQNAAAATEIERALEPSPALGEAVQRQQAAARRLVPARAEGGTRIDKKWDLAPRRRPFDMSPPQIEPPGRYGWQRPAALRDPVL